MRGGEKTPARGHFVRSNDANRGTTCGTAIASDLLQTGDAVAKQAGTTHEGKIFGRRLTSGRSPAKSCNGMVEA
jgi:hypothetical protein